MERNGFPRFQYPKNVRPVCTTNEVIYNNCHILFESWVRPETNQYSYQILSLDNFNELFYKIWYNVVKYNRAPIKVYTFTIAFGNEVFIVLKYLNDDRHYHSTRHSVISEGFVLFSQELVDFLTNLYNKNNKGAAESKKRQRLVVKIERYKLSPQAIKLAEKCVDNTYGITYGPDVQKLVQCYLLPEIEKPYTLLAQALSLKRPKKQSTTDRKDMRYSRFVRTEDIEEPDDFKASELAHEACHDVDKIPGNSRIKPYDPTIQFLVSTSYDKKRACSPIEADIPNSIHKDKTAPNWDESYYQESANLGPKDNSIVNNLIDSNEKNALFKPAEDIQKARRTYFAAKLIQRNYQSTDISNNEREPNKENSETDAIVVCCGLDSRYCNCYSMHGYIPDVLHYEIVVIRFLSMYGGNWRIIMEKITYDKSYAEIYKSGDLHPAKQLNTNRVGSVNLLDAMKKNGKKILSRKFVMTVPCDLYRKWGNQKKIAIDTNDMTLVMVSLNDDSLLSKLNTLSPVYTECKQYEFEDILRNSYGYFSDVEDDSDALLNVEGRVPLFTHERNANSPDSVINIVAEPDISAFVDTHPADQSNDANSTCVDTNSPAKKMISIGIQAVFPVVPFSIVCLADIRTNVINPVITSDHLFNHGFEINLIGNYQTRVEYLQTGHQLETSHHIINILNDWSISMLLKDYTDEETSISKGLDMDYISQVDTLLTDTLEWEKEAVQGVALPFYFKKLKPAFILTENDFPSTLVAKKKITNLIVQACNILQSKATKNMPVLWISTRNLELTTIRRRLTSDHIFATFKKSNNLKYSIDSIYFPDSASRIIHNTKYGTFDTLPMELQQTSNVILKIWDYPRPFLLIISDAYVFNTKLTQQCQGLLQLAKNNQSQTNTLNSETTAEGCMRKSRQSAKKPLNFYNENENCSRNFSMNLMDNAANGSPVAVTSPQPMTRQLNETQRLDEKGADYSKEQLVTTDRNLSQSLEQNKPISNASEINMNVETLNALNGGNDQPKNVRQSTQVAFSLPLQKKYSLIQEKNREIRSRTDKMFLKEDTSKYLKNDLRFATNNSSYTYLIDNKRIIRRLKKPIENNDANSKPTNLNNGKEIEKFSSKKNWPGIYVINQKNISNETIEDTNQTMKFNNTTPLPSESSTKYRPPNNDMKEHDRCSPNTILCNQLTYDDMLTPTSLNESVTNRLKPIILSVETIVPARQNRTIVQEKEQQQHTTVSVMPNNEIQTNQGTDIQLKIEIESEKDVCRKTLLDEDVAEKEPAIISNSDSILTKKRANQKENKQIVDGIQTSFERDEFLIETSELLQDGGNQTIDILPPNERNLESLLLPQLMTHPKQSTSITDMNTDANKNTQRYITCKKSLQEKVAPCLHQEFIQEKQQKQTPLSVVPNNKLQTTQGTDNQLQIGGIVSEKDICRKSLLNETIAEEVSQPVIISNSDSVLSKKQNYQKDDQQIFDSIPTSFERDQSLIDLTIDTSIPQHKDLKSMSLPQLMMTYPRQSTSNAGMDTDANLNTKVYVIYKEMLKEKVGFYLNRDSSRRELQQTNTTSTNNDADISVTLNTSRENGKERSRIRVCSFGDLNFVANPTQGSKTCAETVGNVSSVAIDAAVNSNITPPRANSKQLLATILKRKSQEKTPSKCVKKRQKQATSEKQPQTPASFGKENGSMPSFNQLPLHNHLQNPNVEEMKHISSVSSSHTVDDSSAMGGNTQTVAYSSLRSFVNPPNLSYIERRDSVGNGVNEQPRCQSSCCQPMSRNMQHMPVVPTVPNVLYVQRPSRMMPPERVLPQNAVGVQNTVPRSYSQPMLFPSPIPSASCSDSTCLNRINELHHLNTMRNSNRGPPPSYFNSLNENNQLRMLLTNDMQAHNRMTTERPMYPVENHQMNNSGYFSRTTSLPQMPTGTTIRALPRYYPLEVLESSIRRESIVRMQPPSRQYIDDTHNRRLFHQIFNGNAEYISNNPSMAHSTVFN